MNYTQIIPNLITINNTVFKTTGITKIALKNGETKFKMDFCTQNKKGAKTTLKFKGDSKEEIFFDIFFFLLKLNNGEKQLGLTQKEVSIIKKDYEKLLRKKFSIKEESKLFSNFLPKISELETTILEGVERLISHPTSKKTIKFKEYLEENFYLQKVMIVS